MASKREPGNSGLTHGIDRMVIKWNNILSEEKEGDISKHPYTNWLTLGIGPCREDGSGSSKDTYGNWLTLGIGPCRKDGSGSSKDTDGKGKAMATDDKGKAMATEKKSDSGSSGLNRNWLTLKIGSCIEDDFIPVGIPLKLATEKGESSSGWSWREDGSNKEVKIWEESIFNGHILEDIWNIIFCKLPLHTLFQIQSVSTSWRSIISSSAYFHNLWEQSNMQMWLVMDLYDNTSESSNGLAIFDASRRLLYKKMFNDELRCSNSQWFLRAGDGGLLVYSCSRNGSLRVINPLTMQFHSLEDAEQSTQSMISSYMKTHHDYADVYIKFVPELKSYQVIVVIPNLYVDEGRNEKLVVLVYRSSEHRWEIREAHLEPRPNGYRNVCYFTSILMHNQKIYWFSEDGMDVCTYDLNGDGSTRFLYVSGMQGVMHRSLGIVKCKGRVIMVCKGEPMELPPYTHALIFYELDEVGLQWRSKCEAIVSPMNLSSDVICVGGDYIWIPVEIEGPVNHIICIDVDTGELNIWVGLWEYNGRALGVQSTRLSFCPCS
ncbi:hypothetical protein SUGI_1035000 [Cryptomeria japonica]|nr:hypothetical protein SUGI_1035000 [Cryptomeria japonica]